MLNKKSKKTKKKSNLSYITPCLKGYMRPTVLTPIFIIIEVLTEVIIPLFMAAIIDVLDNNYNFKISFLFSEELMGNKIEFIIVAGSIMVALSVISLVFGMLEGRTSAVSGMGFAKNLRKKLFYKIQELSISDADKYGTASLVTRATTDVNAVQSAFQTVNRVMVRAPIMMILAIILSFTVQKELAMIFVFAAPFIAAGLYFMLTTVQKRIMLMLKKFDEMNAAVQENLIAVRVVKSYVREDYEKEKFDKAARDVRDTQIFAERVFSWSNPIQLGIMYLCTVILLLIGGKMVINGKFYSGELISLLTYMNQIVSSLSIISFTLVSLARSKASLERILEVLDDTSGIINGNRRAKPENGGVEFKNVNFAFNGKIDNPILKDVNFKIESGETVGIIGGTGEGKSSLVQLIPRFYDVSSGNIYIGGVDIKDYDVKALREGISMVLQNNTLFSGTIKENIKWGNENASDEEIAAAAEKAQADGFINNFPDGYNTVLGQGGVNVSGGQKQRICIARAILKKPQILILDDSTSAVDTATDEKIRESLKKLENVTIIIIAQRISSVMGSDKIIVLDNGKISDIGNHSELIKRNKIYSEVYYSQAGGKAEVNK